MDEIELNIHIINITEAQAEAIEDLLRTWVNLGKIGGSRWTAFYADGDGNFRPHITVNDREPQFSPFLTKEDRWREGDRRPLADYAVDFDMIAARRRNALGLAER